MVLGGFGVFNPVVSLLFVCCVVCVYRCVCLLGFCCFRCCLFVGLADLLFMVLIVLLGFVCLYGGGYFLCVCGLMMVWLYGLYGFDLLCLGLVILGVVGNC